MSQDLGFQLDSLLVVYWLSFAVGLFVISQARWIYAYYVFVLPGTFMHELAHWTAAKLLKGKPSGISLRLKKVGNSYALGEVRFVPGQFNTVTIALAPLFLVPLWLFVLPHVALSIPQAFVIGVFASMVASSSKPSTQDIKVAFSRPLGFLPWVPVVSLLYSYLAGLLPF